MEIEEDPNESEKTPAPEPVPADNQVNPYLLSVSKDLRNDFQMMEVRNFIGSDFNYDHRMLVPKKTY